MEPMWRPSDSVREESEPTLIGRVRLPQTWCGTEERKKVVKRALLHKLKRAIESAGLDMPRELEGGSIEIHLEDQ